MRTPRCFVRDPQRFGGGAAPAAPGRGAGGSQRRGGATWHDAATTARAVPCGRRRREDGEGRGRPGGAVRQARTTSPGEARAAVGPEQVPARRLQVRVRGREMEDPAGGVPRRHVQGPRPGGPGDPPRGLGPVEGVGDDAPARTGGAPVRRGGGRGTSGRGPFLRVARLARRQAAVRAGRNGCRRVADDAAGREPDAADARRAAARRPRPVAAPGQLRPRARAVPGRGPPGRADGGPGRGSAAARRRGRA